MTFINTVDGFAWLTLYLETIVSSLAWKPTTSATIALQYRRNLVEWVMKTDPANAWLIDFLAHDFSARGLSPWDMLSSGLGHATSFRGSDTIICIPGARYFYNEPKNEVCINSVNASEHSVSTTKIFTVGEEQMMVDWLTDFNEGIFSMVSDTFDLTMVAKPGPGGFCYNQKDLIMGRNGKLVIRPDSGNPADIICGHGRTELTEQEKRAGYPEFYTKGLIECLWEIFGGTVNDEGYKVLDPHIGAIYGDSITLERQIEIYERLAAKGFASTNIVLGIGSYTYQMNTRDTLGFAAKGSWFEVQQHIADEVFEKVGYNIFKDPVTDDGTKKSLKGMVAVFEDENGDHYVKTECTHEEEETGLLQVIYENGKFYNQVSLKEIRSKVNALCNSEVLV
jgi:nicotinamide phosphoribosyltransferase